MLIHFAALNIGACACHANASRIKMWVAGGVVRAPQEMNFCAPLSALCRGHMVVKA